jgi:hypothetical protein
MQMQCPLATDFRVQRRPGAQALRADDNPGDGELGSDVCWLRNCTCPNTQAESGCLALQMFSGLPTHMAVPVAKNHLRVNRLLADGKDRPCCPYLTS